MYVVKRDGAHEPVHFDKITSRIKKLAYGIDPLVDPVIVSQKVCAGVFSGVTTSHLDELAAETAAQLACDHPDYGLLAARIAVSNLHKRTTKDWVQLCEQMYAYRDPVTGLEAPLLCPETMAAVRAHGQELAGHIVYERDMQYDYFGFKTLERAYLKKMHGQIVERPQHMLMRVAVGIHKHDVQAAVETYDLMSQGYFTHASPTLFNAGTPHPQLSSCFLLQIQQDSIQGIYKTLMQCAEISKHAGGIGLAVHKVRAQGSYIRGTGGHSNGIVPMLRVFNNTARYVDQGGGKRKGAFAVYLEPWHADIFEWLELKKNHGAEETRARDLFFGLWTPDLFMRRVEQDGTWALFCPSEAPGLHEVWGAEFDALYAKYEAEGRARKVVQARDLWNTILQSQIETGTPYMLYKDACNGKSNQQNLGTLQCSNLCTEILEYTAPDEVAVCNLASIALNKFVVCRADDDEKTSVRFDFDRLAAVAAVVTRNLNKIIDINYYPVPEARNSNLRHRPIGIGVQGLADAFQMMRLPFDSPEAAQLNRDIFETVYYAALRESCALARKHGAPYPSFEGSPASKGKLQPDLWGVQPGPRWDWDALRGDIREHGLFNSLLTAPMPTASTSQILGNNECFEPFTFNLYMRQTLAGRFVCFNKHLVRDLVARKLWNPRLKNKLMAHRGSVQRLAEVPDDLKALYKTTWELSGKTLIDMAAARGAFIDQSQSFNVHMENVTFAKLTSMHFYGWRAGLKTGMYYLRSRPAAEAIQFTVDQEDAQRAAESKQDEEGGGDEDRNDDSADRVSADELDAILDDLNLQQGQEMCVSCGS